MVRQIGRCRFGPLYGSGSIHPFVSHPAEAKPLKLDRPIEQLVQELRPHVLTVRSNGSTATSAISMASGFTGVPRRILAAGESSWKDSWDSSAISRTARSQLQIGVGRGSDMYMMRNTALASIARPLLVDIETADRLKREANETASAL